MVLSRYRFSAFFSAAEAGCTKSGDITVMGTINMKAAARTNILIIPSRLKD
jgi:hypothetical protein